MSDGSVFRTADAATPAPAETNAKAADPALVSDTSEKSLFASYEDDQKHPYTADYFEIKEVWDKEPTMARDLKEIEGYIREQVEGKKVHNSTKAAKEFMKELERKAGLSRYESVNQRITKVLAYIDFQRVVHG